MQENKLFQVGVKGLIVQNNKLLLLKSSYKNESTEVWDLPGGRLQKTDTNIEKGLERELAEELPGVTEITIGSLVHASWIQKDFSDGTGWMLLYYMVSVKLPGKIALTDEHSEYLWVSRFELSKTYETRNSKIVFHTEMYLAAMNALSSFK